MYGSPMYASAITRMRTIVSAAEPTGRRRLSPIWSIRDAAVIKGAQGGLLRVRESGTAQPADDPAAAPA